MSNTIGDLTLGDIGRMVTIQTTTAGITGVLQGFRVDQDWISEQTMTDAEPVEIPGRRTITVEVGPWTSRDLPVSTSARLL